MASIIYDSHLNAFLEQLIETAEEQVVLFCPYFKLHDRLRDCLKHRMQDDYLRLIVVFGKNEEEPSKSLNREDLEFLKSFPNVAIRYEKRLHAKYYANEKYGLVTSLNLHSYSQNNNIEIGVMFKTKSLLKNITDRVLQPLTAIVSDTEDLATESYEFSKRVYDNARVIYEREPQYEAKFLSKKKYLGSKVLVDETEQLFEEFKPFKKATTFQDCSFSNYNNVNHTSPNSHVHFNTPQSGFCIRTREQISFDPTRPFSYSAYKKWEKYSNPDYRESYCHGCGISWSTSMRKPLCQKCEANAFN
jgi:hypothetical protein